jgi:diguanylate cyclase (GGDEF)-like protein
MKLGNGTFPQNARRVLNAGGILCLVAVPVDSPMPHDAPRVRKGVFAACVVLASGLALLWPASHLRVASEPHWVAAFLGAGAIAYGISAFLLGNRLAVSRSPALGVLVATFLVCAILMAAYAGGHDGAGSWLWAYWHTTLAVGLIAFVASDWHWAVQQRQSARRGYYADDDLRFKRLTIDGAARQISTAVVAALVAAIALGATIVWPIKLPDPGAAHLWIAVAAAIAASAIVCLFVIPAYRRTFRYLNLLAAAAAGLAVMIIGSALLRQSVGAEALAQWMPLRIGACVSAVIASAAIVMLLFVIGHFTTLRWWMVAASFATVLDCVSMAASTLGLSGGWYISHAFAVCAAMMPLGILLSDVKTSLHIVDKQSAMLNELSLTDRNTGIPNLRALMLHLERQVAHARASRVSFAMTVVDIVGVKAANRAMGRHVGNELIAATARLLRGAFPPEVVVARLKGDEFIVLSPAGELSGASLVRRRIAAALNASTWVERSHAFSLYVDTFCYDPALEQTTDVFVHACIRRAILSKKTAVPVRPADMSNSVFQRNTRLSTPKGIQ